MGTGGHRYFQMESEPSQATASSFPSFRQGSAEVARIFDELPKAAIVSVSRPDAGDISPMLLSYMIEFQYKQVTVSIFGPAVRARDCAFWSARRSSRAVRSISAFAWRGLFS